jgi:hypothetical protein
VNIVQATRSFERWLGKCTPLIRTDLKLKHSLMAQSPLAFLRATFYRWMSRWPETCPELAGLPPILAVGDLHIENFGTWRDIEGRLIWGINDFDEASRLSYATDLVRLATSAILAIRRDHLDLSTKTACAALLDGYARSLRKGGEAFVMGERHRFFIPMLRSAERDPVHFWEKMRGFSTVRGGIPGETRRALQAMLPEPDLRCRMVHRIAGLGSLGKQRVVALAYWHGSMIAREAKALNASSCRWAHSNDGGDAIQYAAIMSRAIRCPDPFVRIQGPWLLRRLAPDCCRIELAALRRIRDQVDLLQAMGWETANVHLGNGESARRSILADLARRPGNWLRKAAKAMAEVTIEDWTQWQKGQAGSK